MSPSCRDCFFFFPTLSGTTWHQASVPSVPANRYPFEFGTVPTYFHKHIRLSFLLGCSTMECAATVVLGFGSLRFLLLWFIPQHVSGVCACFETLTSYDALFQVGGKVSNGTIFYIRAFNVCWRVAVKESRIFLVNWIFSYCMIRVSIVTCKYFLR